MLAIRPKNSSSAFDSGVCFSKNGFHPNSVKFIVFPLYEVVFDSPAVILQTTGKYKSIHAEGPWTLSTRGVFKIQILYDENGVQLPLQTNIFTALGNHAFVLGGEEVVVLAGSYYFSSQLLFF